jgi:hypothetical protein
MAPGDARGRFFYSEIITDPQIGRFAKAQRIRWIFSGTVLAKMSKRYAVSS